MLVLAFALALALTSCGECEHLNTETKQEVTSYGNCKVADKIDEVTVCSDCGEELARVSTTGAIGDHVAGDPVYENVDVLDCTKGGTCDEVVYCSVAKCGQELSRTEIKVAAKAHSNKTRVIYSSDHKTQITLTYCTVCAHQSESETAAPASIPAAHEYQPKAAGTCKYCYDVLGMSTSGFVYELNEGGDSYTLKSVNGSVPQAVFIGHYNGKPVTHIADNAFEGQTSIRAITFGECVKSVGKDAFAGCTAIEAVFTYNLESWSKINFANVEANPLHAPKAIFRPNQIAVDSSKAFSTERLTKIGSYAFAGLKVSSIYIDSATTEIGEGAFANCTSLVKVHLQYDANEAKARTISAKAFDGCENIRSVYADSLTAWLSNSFADIKANPTYYADTLYFGDKAFDSATLDLSGVTSVPTYAFASLKFTAVKIPAALTSIGNGAFANCKKLSSVVFADGSQLSGISASAFAGCSALADITLPASVKTIGNNAFEGCSAMTEAPLTDSITSIGAYAFKGCTAIVSVKLPTGLTSVAKGVFENCSALTELEFGAELTEISESAFANCKSITALDFPAKLETVGSKAFSGCVSLAEIDLKTNLAALETIGAGAFAGCSGAKKILVSDSVSEIALGAFEGCSSVESISVPFIGKAVGAAENNFGYIFGATETTEKDEDNNDVIIPADNRAYVPYSLSDIVITGNITAIAKDAFKDCEGAVSIKLPESIKTIGANAFEGCTGLEAVYVSSIEKWCGIEFANYLSNPLALANVLCIAAGAEPVTALTVSANVNAYAFYGAAEIFCGENAITALVIGEGVTAIGNDAFHGATALNTVTLPTTLKTVGARAFFGCDEIVDVKIADVNAWCKVAFADAFANPLYYAKNLYVAGIAVTELTVSENVGKYAFIACELITKVTFADSVAEVADSAFYGCSSIKSLVLNKVAVIGVSAFESCVAIESVSLGVAQNIGARAFANCVALKDTLTVPDTVTAIGSEAFVNCSKIDKVILGSALKTIGVSAFYNCKSLAEVNIPASVTAIGANAFGDCPLAKVSFANASGWTVNGNKIASTDLTGADADATLAKAAAKLAQLSAYEWTRA